MMYMTSKTSPRPVRRDRRGRDARPAGLQQTRSGGQRAVWRCKGVYIRLYLTECESYRAPVRWATLPPSRGLRRRASHLEKTRKWPEARHLLRHARVRRGGGGGCGGRQQRRREHHLQCVHPGTAAGPRAGSTPLSAAEVAARDGTCVSPGADTTT